MLALTMSETNSSVDLCQSKVRFWGRFGGESGKRGGTRHGEEGCECEASSPRGVYIALLPAIGVLRWL